MAIIICTDFSDASRNALSYTCAFMKSNQADEVELILLHLYEVPSSYAGDGLALTTVNSEIDHAEDLLQDEFDWIKEQYPDLNINPKVVAGALHKGLEEQIEEINPALVVLGANGHYSDILSWDRELLVLFRDLSVPVMVIPKHKSYSPITRVAYTCNLDKTNDRTPFNLVSSLVEFTKAQLFVLLISKRHSSKTEKEKEVLMFIENKLKGMDPKYFPVDSEKSVETVGQFVKDQLIDLLVVIPRKEGVWQDLVNKDRAKDLVKLDAIPILALRQN